MQVLFVFTCHAKDGTELDLVFLHYYDMPGGNAHRRVHKKVVHRLAEDIEKERSETRCLLVVPAYIYTGNRKEPFVGVVPITDVSRLVALAPRFEAKAMDCSSWFVYDLVMPDRLTEHRSRLAEEMMREHLV